MKIEVRGDQVTVDGYVNAVERDSKILYDEQGPFVERAEAGVFQRAIEAAENVRVMLNHQRDVGSTAEGTLKLQEDAVGLRATAIIRDPEVVQEARAGHLTGWSFGFTDNAPNFEVEADSEVRKRTLRDITLHEVSILTIAPAYIATTIEARAEGGSKQQIRSIDDAPEITQDDFAAEMAAYRIRRLKMED